LAAADQLPLPGMQYLNDVATNVAPVDLLLRRHLSPPFCFSL